MARFLLVLAALLVPAAAVQGSLKEHPVEKVISLLQGLAEKAEAEGKEEALSYEKFVYWCKNSEKTLNAAIAEETEAIEELSALISSKEEAKEVLEKQIGDLVEELKELQNAGREADASRLETKGIYDDESLNLDKTIKAVQDCIKELEGAKDTTDPENTALVQVQQKMVQVIAMAATKVTKQQLTLLQEFAQQRPTQLAKGDRAKHVDEYAFKSQSVIELLKDLEAKFSDEKLEVVKAETNSINAYELAKAAREDLTNAATESKKTKNTELGEVKTALNTANTDRDNERDDLKADSGTLKDTKKDCAVKASEWEERSATRKGEIEAINTAVGILSKATGVRTEAPSNPVPPPSPVAGESFLQKLSLLQLPDKKQKAVDLLRREAKVAHSKALEQLATEVAAHLTGPFDEVNNMIEKMIFRLMDEQKNEDEHKHWCDQELEKTNTSKVDKEDKIAELTAKIDDGKAKSTLLQEDIADADKMVNTITEHMAEATDIRKIGKEENKKSVKDAEDAQTAVSNAIAVLEAFYKESGMVAKESWEFLQRGADPVTLSDNPSTWDSGYTGVSDPEAQPDGILSVMKKISADFAKMESETIAQEETDQDAYDQDMKDCSIEKARRMKESEMKAQEKKRTDEKVASMEKARKGVEKEHEAVVQYLSDLQPACVEGDSTYEDRKAARTKEIGALKQAKGILADAFKEEKAKPETKLLQGNLRRQRK